MREPRPITRVELTDKNRTLRWIAVVALLVIGIVGITVGVVNFLNNDTGWQVVQITTEERSCSENFILQYNFSGTGAEATVVNRKLESTYEEACVKAYQLFTPDEDVDGVNNVYYVNHHPNEVITVDPVLYAAFEKLEGTPWLYLGPAYAHYYNIILGAEEALIDALDPNVSQEAKSYVGKIAEFAADRNQVRLELLGDCQVKLHVSEEYLEFADEEEIENFIDLAYLTNAFTIDYLADMLTAQGLTEGYLVSVDGYTRNLESRSKFNFSVFDREGNVIYPAGVMEYQGPISMVYLKDYPTADSETSYRANGDRIIHLFADPVDGVYRTSTENLISYSYDAGCADVLLQMLPSFVGSDFTVPEGVFSIWCEGEEICYNDESISFVSLLKSEDASYQAVLKK